MLFHKEILLPRNHLETMASKRLSKTSVDWAKFQKLLPQDQQHIYSNLLAKSYQYTLKLTFSFFVPSKSQLAQNLFMLYFRVASLPENLPKIDFESYRKQLPNPSAIEKLEKGVINLNFD